MCVCVSHEWYKGLTCSHVVDAFHTQWRDATLAVRSVKAQTTEAFLVVVDNFLECDQQNDGHIYDDESTQTMLRSTEYTDDDGDELEGSAYTVGPPTDDPEHFAIVKMNVSFCRVSKVPQTMFLLLVLLTALAQLRKLGKCRNKSKIGKKKRTNSLHTGGKSPNSGTFGVLPHTPTSHSDLRQPMCKTLPVEIGTVRVDHLRLFACVLISECWVALLGIVRQKVPTMQRSGFMHTWQMRINCSSLLNLLLCSIMFVILLLLLRTSLRVQFVVFRGCRLSSMSIVSCNRRSKL